MRGVILASLVFGPGLGQICTMGTDTFCRSCGELSCAYCVNSYQAKNGTCLSVASDTVKNCISYSSSTVCKSCAYSYYLSDINSCLELSGNCISISDSGECSLCAYGYVLDGGRNCVKGACQVANCNWCGSDGACVLCKNDHVLKSDNTCVAKTTALENCMALSPASDSECGTCASGFYIDSKKGCTYSRNAVTFEQALALVAFGLAVFVVG